MGAEKTKGSNEELSLEDQKKIEEEMKKSREEEEDEENPNNILVRGARLWCSCGTHPRRLNLPLSYGVYAKDEKHPKVHMRNNEVGDDKNIAYYGVCQSENPPKEKMICVEPYVTDDGKKTSDSNIDGYMCTPYILGSWLDVKEDEVIFDQDKNKNFSGLTTKSFLVCKYGGVIEVETSGQEYDGK